MDADAFARLFRLICKDCGLPSGRVARLFNGWKVFPYPFYENGHQLGVKIMAYSNIASGHQRAAQLGWNHIVNSFVSGVGAPTAGLGAMGAGVVTAAGKFGGLRPAFGVNMGSVGASHVMRKASSNPDPKLRASAKASAIIASGHLLAYGVGRIDQLGAHGYDVFFFLANRPDGETDHLERTIREGRIDQSRFRRYRVHMNGDVMRCAGPGAPGMTRVGNARTRQLG